MEITPFIVMEVLERAKQLETDGEQIIHLEIGEPDFDTPDPVKEAAIKAIKEGDTQYTHSLGKYDFREEIAAYYHRTYNVTISPEQIIVTMGSSTAMLLAFSALLEKGGEIIISNPHYACYPNFIRYTGGKPILEKTKVAVTPGIDFGSNGEGYLRISYANSMENIKEGMDRLESFLKEIEGRD